MSVYTQYTVTVQVEAPAERKVQLEEVVQRFLKDLLGHEFHASGGTVDEGQGHVEGKAHKAEAHFAREREQEQGRLASTPPPPTPASKDPRVERAPR